MDKRRQWWSKPIMMIWFHQVFLITYMIHMIHWTQSINLVSIYLFTSTHNICVTLQSYNKWRYISCSFKNNLYYLLYLTCGVLHSHQIFYDVASETNTSRDCKHEQLDWFLAKAIEIVETLFNELGWLLLENKRLMHKCTMVFKCINGLALPYRIDSFNANTFNHSYSIRKSSKFRIAMARTEYYHRSFFNIWM